MYLLHSPLILQVLNAKPGLRPCVSLKLIRSVGPTDMAINTVFSIPNSSGLTSKREIFMSKHASRSLLIDFVRTSEH